VGNFLAVQHKVRKEAVIIVVSELTQKDQATDFQRQAEDFRDGLLASIRNQKAQPEQIKFSVVTIDGEKNAELSFQAQAGTNINYYYGRYRLAGKNGLSFNCIGRGVKIKEDNEVLKIIKSVVVPIP
jgi:hypothetical protein